MAPVLCKMSSLLLSSFSRSLRSTARLCSVSQPNAVYKPHFIAGARWSTRWSSRLTNVTEAARAAPALGRYRTGALIATGVFGIVAAGVCHLQQAEMATRVKKLEQEEQEEGHIAERCKKFMSLPVTDVRVLEQRKHEVRSRMEMVIMETQAEFCRALEEVDGGTFKVDRWSREEGAVLLLFILQEFHYG